MRTDKKVEDLKDWGLRLIALAMFAANVRYFFRRWKGNEQCRDHVKRKKGKGWMLAEHQVWS